MKKLIVVFLMLIAGCASFSKDPVATYRAIANGYEVTVTGSALSMGHDPLYAVSKSIAGVGNILGFQIVR